jgi:hypothetical protein
LALALSGSAAHLESTPDPPNGAQRKLALLVGIDHYQAVTGLNGCVNDVERMKGVLVGQFGFRDDDVLILKNDDATNAGIRRAFQKHLIDQAKTDDVVVFHFSGHGSRMKDVSGDEPDGWDETIVPVDSRKQGIYDIPDDDLNDLLRKLAAKTKYVTFILDSCHSGSASRGGVLVRQIKDDERRPPPSSGAPRARGAAPTRFAPGDASYVLIAGCGPKELSNEYETEGQSFGALTYFLTSELSRADSGKTYRDIMDRVRNGVAAVYPSQHPQLEGSRADTEAFGTADRPAEAYFAISPQQGKQVRVKGGRTLGLTQGSVLEVYPPGTKVLEPGKGKAQVSLTEVRAFDADGEILSGGPIAAQSRAAVRERKYPDERFRVYLGGISSPDVVAALKERINARPELELVLSEPAARMSVVEKDGALQCISGDKSNVAPPVPLNDPQLTRRIADQLAHWAKWYSVLLLSNSSPDIAVNLDIPVPQSGAFTDRDEVTISVKNVSKTDVYVAIVDLSGDGSVTPIYPEEGQEETLSPGLSLPQKVGFSVPEGKDSVNDVIKVIATTEYIEPGVFRLEAVRADLSPLARLIGTRTSRGVTGIKTVGWTTLQQPITIRRAGH